LRKSVALLVAALLAFQTVPAFALLASSSQRMQPAPSSGSGAPTFTPDYIILGQLSGTTVQQSSRPRSANIPQNYQYAATYYGAGDLQSAYGVDSFISSGYNGRGETIAVIDAYGDPTIHQDLATFDKEFGLPTANLTVVPVGPYEPSLGITYGWDSETALDVEAAHAMAPYAHINLIVGANASNALYEAVKLVVTHRLGNVVTMSWGIGENSFGESGWSASGFLNYPYVEYWLQLGAKEGITFLSSTGDYGAFEDTTALTASYPADSPFVTGVGGTTLFLTPQIESSSYFNSTAIYEGEQAWSVSPQYVGPQGVSSGGGYSVIFPQPYYQAGVTASKARSVPDVSADANPYTGLIIVLGGVNYVIGGTSLSSPLWAGMTADLDQYVGRNLGNLNPYLYAIYGNKAEYNNDFHQVTYGFNGEYQAGPGYNLVTGLGSPILPNLASDIRALAQGLTISVSTSSGPSSIAPTQYTSGEAFKISAAISTPTGSTISTGTFTAEIDGPNGVIATVPLTFSGSWTGSHTISASDPPGQWTIAVSGSSGSLSGDGLAEVTVGNSIAILGPVPYPFAGAVTPGVRFIIQTGAGTAGGAPIDNATLTANLIYEGKTVSSTPLTLDGTGMYDAAVTLASSQPQGTYTLTVSGPSFAPATEYLYVGEEVTGVMITPNDDAIPSASQGQLVTLLAETELTAGTGIFTSNATAKIYSLSGTLMSSVNLTPAPDKVQFGVFNFFRYQQANFTIPSNLTQGFYRLEFLSSYKPYNSTAPPILGNFTTGFYVGGPSLSYSLTNSPTSVFTGQDVNTVAKITDSNGTAVTSGVFLATFIPSGYAYEAYVTDYSGYTSVPMVYVPALGGWYAQYQIPSPLTSANGFTGNVASLQSGPWTIFISGESQAASNVLPSNSYINVLPYVDYTEALLDQTSVKSAPLVVVNGTGYSLSGIGATSLEVSGLSLTLSGVSIENLTLVNSRVILDNSQIGEVSVTNSTFTAAQGTKLGMVSPPVPVITLSGISQPLTGNTGFTVNVSGELLNDSSLAATIDGSPISLTSTASSSGLTAHGTVNIGPLPDGIHTLTLTATQSDGQSSTLTTYFSVNTQEGIVANLVYLLLGVTALAIVALVAAVMALRRKPSLGPMPSPQV
jgi:subtilase family serine protease